MDPILKAKVEALKESTDEFLNNASPEEIEDYKSMLKNLKMKANQDTAPTSQENNSVQESNGIGSDGQVKGNSLTKAKPGVPRMFDWDSNGFSRYFVLAGFAFVIQLIVTLICIFFYK